MGKRITYKIIEKGLVTGNKVVESLSFVIGKEVQIVDSLYKENEQYSIPVVFIDKNISKEVRKYFGSDDSQIFDVNVPRDLMKEIKIGEKFSNLLKETK